STLEDRQCFKLAAGPSLRCGSEVSDSGHGQMPQVRGRSLRGLLCEAAVRAHPHFVSGPRLTLLTVAKRWTLTSFRSGLNILAVGSCWTITSFRSGLNVLAAGSCFKSGHDFL